ncbi:DUF3039 domain-containing protein [Hyphomonas sp.]
MALAPARVSAKSGNTGSPVRALCGAVWPPPR